MKVFHHFNEGLYTKETHFDAGEWGEKHVHPYTHRSRLVSGIARLQVDEAVQTLIAPAEVVVEAGKKHVVFAVTPIVWLCEHETDCTDPLLIDEHLTEAHHAMD